MTIIEFYEKIGGDYNNIKSRLMDDNIIKKFVLKFMNENTYNELMSAVEENNIEETILASHKLKGVTANLSFDRLCGALTELLIQLRDEKRQEIDKTLVEQITRYYNEIIELIPKV